MYVYTYTCLCSYVYSYIGARSEAMRISLNSPPKPLKTSPISPSKLVMSSIDIHRMNDDNHNMIQDQLNNNHNNQNNNKSYNNKNQTNIDNGYDKNANNQISLIVEDDAPNLNEKLRNLDLKNSSLFDGGMWALANQLQYAGIHLNTLMNVYMFIFMHICQDVFVYRYSLHLI